MLERVKNLSDKYYEKIVNLRHQIHMHPELEFEEENTARLLVGCIDAISISLNAPTAEEYVKVTRPKFGTEAFYAMIEFAKYVKENIGDVAFSVVNVINDEQIERCKSLADEMGIPLKEKEKEE